MPAGDPRDPAFRIGPMISEADAQRAESWLAEAADAQARIECGGTRDGPVLQATVLSQVRPGLKVIDREIFAPVVSLLPFDRLSEAIDSINALPFGLATGIFTRDLDRALQAARAVRSGAVHVNETSSSRVDGMPYGGVKDSGFGREGPRYAIREMTEEKMITVAPARPA
jgi:succinate-semialdehyde dehydrogenase/glutarate-semialdehyde dehydrogenase